MKIRMSDLKNRITNGCKDCIIRGKHVCCLIEIRKVQRDCIVKVFYVYG